jgi:hypothetical protein
MLATSGRSSFRKLVISPVALWTGALVLAAAFGGGVWGMAYVYRMYTDARQFQEEYQALRAVHDQVSTSYELLKQRLSVIEELESKVRTVFDLGPADEVGVTSSSTGQGGGPEPESSNVLSELTSVTDDNDNMAAVELGLDGVAETSDSEYVPELVVITDDALLRADRLLRSWTEIDEQVVVEYEDLALVPSVTPLNPGSPHWLSSDFGTRNSPFTGRKEFHGGLDISARTGTPVIAPADGIVVEMWNTRRGGALGNAIKLRHSGHRVTYETLYGHLRKKKPFADGLRVGSRVKRHQVIGYVGSTGRTTASHLHYEVRMNGKRVNPWRFLLDR